MSAPPNPPDSGGWWSRIWRRLRANASGDGAVRGLDEERRALKAAILRKRRNDRVRHNELNELRARIRARRAAAAPAESQQASPPSLPGVAGARSGWPRRGPDKSRTIEQIARIEAQMGRHWTPRAAESSGLRIGAPAPASAGPIVSRHLQARADGFGMSIDLLTAEPSAQAPAPEVLLTHPALTEAAVRFANGRLDEARQVLETVQAQEVRTPLARLAGRMLLEVLWAAGDVEGFEEWAAEWAERFRQPVPRWPVMRPPAEAPSGGTSGTATTAAWHTWVCPPLLDAAAVTALAALAERSNGAPWLDWSDLLSAEADAAARLAALFERWADRPLTMRWRGGAVLRRRLKASTPSGRRENPAVWWRLRLAALRLMGRRDEFDLVALDYCVTYGEVPPTWHDPVAHVEPAEALPEPPTAAAPPAASPAEVPPEPAPAESMLAWPVVVSSVTAGESEFPAVPTQMAGWSIQTQTGEAGPAVCLEGVLQGDMAQALQALDAAVEDVAPRAEVPVEGAVSPLSRVLVIDARRLQRVDFAAAGALLQWLLAARGRGVRVELDGVNHLLAALFHVVGIDEVATVRLRQY
ncbi:STAS domain-containing protein [Tepidimonas sp.]|uniref:STAS domain-containing protein n=1 Tax=Tepidimonas sp. TaxID=2002775 RepID=UPI002FDFC75B